MTSIAVSPARLQKWGTLGLLWIVGYATFGWHFSLLLEVASGPHLAAPGFGFLSNLGPWFTYSLSWIVVLMLAAGALLVWVKANDRRIGFWILAVGALALILQFLTVEKRLVFNYFPSFALMATGLAIRFRSHAPLLMLVVSLYFAAATHKLINFPKILTYIPETISVRLPQGLVEFAPEVAIWLPKVLSLIVIPLEYTMAICLAIPRLRLVGFVLALAFHTMVSSFTNDADALSLVGLFVLYAHGLQFSFFASRSIEIGKTALAVIGISLLAWFAMIHPDLVGLRKAIAFYLPIAFLVLSIFVSADERARLRDRLPDISRAGWVYAWIFVLILWCIYPAMIGYRSQQYGWAMMSGAHLGRPVGCLALPRNSCADRWFFEPHVKTLRLSEDLVFASNQSTKLEQVRKELKRRCGLEASVLGRIEVGGNGLCRLDGH
jgi:hypothetical protein